MYHIVIELLSACQMITLGAFWPHTKMTVTARYRTRCISLDHDLLIEACH